MRERARLTYIHACDDAMSSRIIAVLLFRLSSLMCCELFGRVPACSLAVCAEFSWVVGGSEEALLSSAAAVVTRTTQVSFPDDAILDNLRAFMVRARPPPPRVRCRVAAVAGTAYASRGNICVLERSSRSAARSPSR